MRAAVLAFLFLTATGAFAAKHPDFTGAWEFNPGKSKNIGMIMQAKMTSTITQTNSAIDESTHSNFQDSEQEMKTHYDLTGTPASNESPMAGASETVSKWEGEKLITIWTSQSAIAGGAKIVRTETRWLSPDGNTMTIESVRGTNPPVVMVFEKKK